jgi:hypothetical protein
MSFLREFPTFLMARKKLGLAPIRVIKLLSCGTLVATTGSAAAPFINTLL